MSTADNSKHHVPIKQAKEEIQTAVKSVIPKLKTVKIKHHHAKPYRKRHVTSFVFMLIAGLLLVGSAIKYNSRVSSGVQSAKDFLGKAFATKTVMNQTIESTYGYSLTLDANKFYATAIDSNTGDIFIGQELTVRRPYEVVRIAPTLLDAKVENTNLTARYYPKTAVANPNDLAAIEAMAIKDITSQATMQAKKTGTSNVVYGNKQFLKTDWEFQSNSKVLAGYSPSFVTFTALVSDKPFVIEIVGSNLTGAVTAQYEEILQSLYFGPSRVSEVNQSSEIQEKITRNRSLIDVALFGGVAHAADASSSVTTSEQISSTYGPAVVKIYNVYCEDIYYDGELALRNVCSGGTGSGFFINSNGHIATNGHVIVSEPKDLLIYTAFRYYILGSAKVVDILASKAGITAADLPSGDTKTRIDALFNLFYGIDDSHFTTQNSVVNLLVSLGKDQPDVKELVKSTTNRQEYPEQSTIKRASIVGKDYRYVDGIAKFYNSDVAIIKVDGDNYPVTKLGAITGLMQGANLNILGYPGNASNNGIVDSTQSTVTLTSGKVSSIKNALGSDKKLIETDTTIGHGNSGGPAFNDGGEVMGVSTYTAARTGDGTYNYVRDIKDLIDLASAKSVTISKDSKTQAEWEKALALFNKAHYSAALKPLNNVKKLYAAHPRVEEFIAAANDNIKAGKDVKDFPIVLVIAGSTVLLAGAGIAVVMIVRHKKAHNVYKTHVTTGMMQPLPQGAAPQTVTYDPAHIAAQKNVLTAGQPAPQYAQPAVAAQQPVTTPQTAVASQPVSTPVAAQPAEPTVVQPTNQQNPPAQQ